MEPNRKPIELSCPIKMNQKQIIYLLMTSGIELQQALNVAQNLGKSDSQQLVNRCFQALLTNLEPIEPKQLFQQLKKVTSPDSTIEQYQNLYQCIINLKKTSQASDLNLRSQLNDIQEKIESPDLTELINDLQKNMVLLINLIQAKDIIETQIDSEKVIVKSEVVPPAIVSKKSTIDSASPEVIEQPLGMEDFVAKIGFKDENISYRGS